MRTLGPDAEKTITAVPGRRGGTGRLSRRELLSAAAGAVVTAWAVDALRAAEARAAAPGNSSVRSVLNVQNYGADGKDKKDDTAALKRAIDASGEGDALYFPAGTYLVSEPLLPKPHQLFFSRSPSATVKAHPGLPAFPIFVVRSGPVEFRGLVIDGSKDRMTAPADSSDAPAIYGELGPGRAIVLSVSGCRIRKAYTDGISIAGDPGSGGRPQHVIVRDTVVEDCGLNGLSFGRIDNVRVESSRFERCNNGIKMLGCQDVLVQGVTAHANRRHGIAFTFSHRWRVEHCTASGNGFGEDRGWGIAAGGEDIPDLVPNSDFTITDSICMANAKGGITLDPTMPAPRGEREAIWAQRAKVSGNTCSDASLGHGIQITHASDVLVTDNRCARNTRGSGIQLVDSGRVRVQANMCSYNHIGIGEFVDGCVEPPEPNVISNNKLDNNDVAVRQKKTDECVRK